MPSRLCNSKNPFKLATLMFVKLYFGRWDCACCSQDRMLRKLRSWSIASVHSNLAVSGTSKQEQSQTYQKAQENDAEPRSPVPDLGGKEIGSPALFLM